MAPEPAGADKPLTAAQKKNQARAAARKAKKAAEKAAAIGDALGDGVDDTAEELDVLSTSRGAHGGGAGGERAAAGVDVGSGHAPESVDTAKKV